MKHHKAHTAVALGAALATAVAAALATSLATATSALASTAIAVDTSWHGQAAHGLLPDRVDCTTNLGVCELYVSGNVSYTGSFVGAAHIVVHGHFTPTGGFAFVAHGQLSGTLAGCGSGTVRDTAYGTFSSIVPGQLSLGGQADSSVDPGSGTGALTGLTYSGIETYLLSPTGAVSGRGVGTAYCEQNGPGREHARARHHSHRRHHGSPNRRA
jgi:hypothetical protein